MKIINTILAAIAAIGLAAPAPADEPRELGVETRIPFADSIRNFEADDNHGVWLQDNRDDWYYASVAGPCRGLDFAHSIGFVSRTGSAVDSFSSIVADGEVCRIVRLVTSAPPAGYESDDGTEEEDRR